MKIILLLITNSIFVALTSSAKEVKVSLALSDVGNRTTLYLMADDNLDSTILQNGKGSFYLPIKENPYSIVIYSDDKKFRYVLFIEDKDIYLTGSFLKPRGIICNGSVTQNEFLEYLSIVEPLRLLSDKMVRARNIKSADSIKQLIIIAEKKFTSRHMNSIISVDLPYYAFRNKYITAAEAIEWLKTMYDFQGIPVKAHIKTINQIKSLKDGDPAPDFQSWDVVNNRLVSSKDFVGKTVIINFWASWCGPCLAKLPVIKEFLNRKTDDIVFISISIDNNKDELNRAITYYQIRFPVLADFSESSQVVKEFGIGPIPATFIINKKGKIREINFSSVKSLENEINNK